MLFYTLSRHLLLSSLLEGQLRVSPGLPFGCCTQISLAQLNKSSLVLAVYQKRLGMGDAAMNRGWASYRDERKLPWVCDGQGRLLGRGDSQLRCEGN